jgi:hypothetical protein
MPITVTFGRLNFGATSEQALKTRLKAKIFQSRGNMLQMIPQDRVAA